MKNKNINIKYFDTKQKLNKNSKYDRISNKYNSKNSIYKPNNSVKVKTKGHIRNK